MNLGYELQLLALGNASVEAQKRVQNPKCAALFNTPFFEGLDATDVAELELSGANFGLDYLRNTNYRILPLEPTTVEHHGPAYSISAVGAQTVSPTEVQINQSGPFFNSRVEVPGIPGAINLDFGTGLNQTSLGALLLLHELGHQVGLFGHDRLDRTKNRAYTQAVIDACFPDARNHR